MEETDKDGGRGMVPAKRACKWRQRATGVVQLHFLGTSSGVPTAMRNVTSQCLRFTDDRLWMLDCGEGTQLRIIHHGLTFEKIDKIFITHLHGDHCYGLFGLLMMLSMKGNKRPIDDEGKKVPFEIVGPKGIRAMLEGVYAHSQGFLDIPIEYTELEEGKSYDLGVKENGWHVSAYPLHHRVSCFGYVFKEPPEKGSFDAQVAISMGVPKSQLAQLAKGNSITLPDGRSLTHSDCLRPGKEGRCIVLLGDTCNSDSLADAAKGCDLLVHEATFDATMADRARETGHSTSVMAGQFAANIGAKRLVITHFSARYEQPWNEEKVPTIDDLLEEARAQCPDIPREHVYAAYDFWWLDLPKRS